MIVDPASVFAEQGTSVLLVPIVVEWMKRSNLPGLGWIGEGGRVSPRLVAWTLGLVSALGIHATADVSSTGVFSFVVDLSHLTVGGLAHTAFAGGGQLTGQQMIYWFMELCENARATRASLAALTTTLHAVAGRPSAGV